ncbi:NAD(P)(+)--arginine ADP-ribosyltransferase 2-like [Labeo rohita]|uniref:NAD(P)(+)--arginine ADP-ribosyltransferase 2-like n=1 Tax=Labeo rohita TaxID=84645 RepID=UPI0021E22191|nr:NAD(P)(+)--arginine ADP-ribosyltransferase 2-like [Labeo rohita]
MLQMIEALLLISAAIGQVHSATTAEPILPLDMALSSVDDQYDGCTDKMAKLVTTKLLETELSSSTEFNTAWQKSKGKEPKEALTKNHMIAIYVYTDSIYKSLNEADRHDREKYIDKTYKWYSLHFLLTEAIQILKKTQKSCYSTYRSVHREFDKNVLNKEVRFGSFTSSSLNKKVAEMYSDKSCFEVNTCYGADITNYSRIPDEEEVLIPPYEKFKVTAVKTKSVQKMLWCDTVFVLKSTGIISNLNCALFKEPTNSVNVVAG